MSTSYRVFFTPQIRKNVYGSEIEVTDKILVDGVPSIKRSLDSEDYDIGVFTYDDLNLKAENVNGYFNDEFDQRSIFVYSRDLCKVRIVFEDESGQAIVYRGLINEEASRTFGGGDQVNFRVLSLDSVIRNTQVSGGQIANGTSCKTAMIAILSDPTITSILNIDPLNINPDLDFTIDVGEKLENQSARDSLSKLLIASNSILIIDDTQTVFVHSRRHDTTRDVVNLYGPDDIKYRQNVITLDNYNAGFHRMFTAVRVNDTERTNTALISTYGYRQKRLTLDFVTNVLTEIDIAQRLLDEFSAPKIELTVQVPTRIARKLSLLDRLSVNWPLRVKPPMGKFLPVVGTAVVGDAMTPLPDTFGSISIDPGVGFKIIGITEEPKDFLTTLKIRQIGTTLSDGYLSDPEVPIVGLAIIGIAILAGPGDTDATWNPSVVGAAKIGATKVA